MDYYMDYILLLLLTITMVAYLYVKRAHTYWKRKGVMQEDPSSYIFGNIKDVILLRKNFGVIIQELYSKYEGEPYIGYYEFHQPVLLLRDPQLVQTVLMDKSTCFANKVYDKNKHDKVLGWHLFNLNGSEWKKRRSIFDLGQTPKKLGILADIVKSDYVMMKQFIDKDPYNIGVDNISTRFANNTVCQWCWGEDGQGYTGNSELSKIMDFRMFESYKITLLHFCPWISNFLRITMFPKTAWDHIYNKTKKSLSNYQQTFSYFLKEQLVVRNTTAKTNDRSKVEIEEEVSQLMSSFVADGYFSAAKVLSLVLYQLMMHPQLQEKIRREIYELPEEEYTNEGVKKLEYTDMFISEALRMNSFILVLSKVCVQKCTVGSLEIEPGCGISIPAQAFYMDPKYFPDPGTFNPENFRFENRKKLHKYIDLAFGQGARMCNGRKFVLTELKLMLCYLLRDYEILPATKYPPIKMRPCNYGHFFMWSGKHYLQFKKINDTN